MSTPPKTQRRTKPPGAYTGKESQFQSSSIKVMRMLAPGKLIIHVPNGRNAGSRGMGGFWMNQGVVSGIPDILMFHPSCDSGSIAHHDHYGLALELKVYPNKPTEDQLRIHDILRSAGWQVHVCYGLNEVERITREYLGLP